VPRGARIEDGDLVHHVTARAPSGKRLFVEAADYVRYLGLAKREIERRTWQLFSYCLMPNHVHLLLRTPDRDLSLGIQRVHGDFARYLHDRHGTHGHVFGARFHNRLVRSDRHLVACLRYIARNPVAAGLAATPGAWPWTAHRILAGDEPDGALVAAEAALAHFDSPAPRQAYRQLANQADDALVRSLEQHAADERWIVDAVDLFGVTVATLSASEDRSPSTIRRRLASARMRTRGQSPHAHG
jgi:REP element-mobilizing transposase RayT